MAKSSNGAAGVVAGNKGKDVSGAQAYLAALSVPGIGATIVDRFALAFRSVRIPAGHYWAPYEMPDRELTPDERIDFYYRRASSAVQGEAPNSLTEAVQFLIDAPMSSRDKTTIGLLAVRTAVEEYFGAQNVVLSADDLDTQVTEFLSMDDMETAPMLDGMVSKAIERVVALPRTPRARKMDQTNSKSASISIKSLLGNQPEA